CYGYSADSQLSVSRYFGVFTNPSLSQGKRHRTWESGFQNASCRLESRSLPLNSHFLRGVLVGADAEQGADVAGFLKGWVGGDELYLRAIAQSQIHQRVCHVAEFAGWLAAYGARGRHPYVQVAAVAAFRGLGLKTAAHQKDLDFLALQRAQNVAQPNRATGTAMRLANDLAHQGLQLLLAFPIQDAGGMPTDVLRARRYRIHQKTSLQALLKIGM